MVLLFSAFNNVTSFVWSYIKIKIEYVWNYSLILCSFHSVALQQKHLLAKYEQPI